MRELRLTQRLTQQQLASQCSCSRQEISRMENGHFRGGFNKVSEVFKVLGRPLQPAESGRIEFSGNKPLCSESSRDLHHAPCSLTRILAIDDDPEVLHSYKKLFEVPSRAVEVQGLFDLLGSKQEEVTTGFQVDTTDSGKQGLEMVRSALERGEPYTVLLLDMRMPGRWSGLKTAQALRKSGLTLPIILISAYKDYTLEHLREEIGGAFVIHPKPYVPEELMQLTHFVVTQANAPQLRLNRQPQASVQ